ELALKADILRTNKNKGSVEHVNKLYNLFAPFYDLVWPSMKDYMQSCRYLVEKSVTDGEHVLDVGTGTGVLSLLVAERGNRVVGFDLHPKMLARTRKKAEKQGRKNANMTKLTLCRGDATTLPFGTGAFDVVTSGFMLVHLSHEQKISAVREMRRVLKDRGQIALLESRGELTKRYDTREEWESILHELGFALPTIEDIYDVYRVIFARKTA
ncbi:MAG: class I SAM-dependent methyltransferase, partial [Candidatus Wallbacteria bacterium]|nr:class I SAM-dependent methyltransferase [Candidatus Wallbacteria bacterium]